MATSRHCDSCGKLISVDNPVMAKVYLAKKTTAKSDHANYSAHADVGKCCFVAVSQRFKWQKRRSIPRREKVA